jgi:carbamoyltransferase
MQPPLHDLRLELEKLTGNGVVLNTSFNLCGEPMIYSQADALDMFFGFDLQYLVMGDALMCKGG